MGPLPARAVGHEPGGMELREFEAALIRDRYRYLLVGASLRSIAAQWNAAGSPRESGERGDRTGCATRCAPPGWTV